MDQAVAPTAGPGRLIAGRYLLVAPLGGGGTATVWHAVDQRLGREVAVKLLDGPQAQRARLEQEARAIAALDHPAIVGVYDVVTDASGAAIVMALVRGESLASRLRRTGPMPERTALLVVGPIASALAHAHARGVVHCDVKPANILIDTDGRPRLADFGIARAMAAPGRVAPTATIEGTLSALAPERLSGQEADAPADVFALGVVLYECLAARPPWPARTPADMLRAEQALPTLPAGVSSPVASLLAACLAPNPAARPTAAAVATRVQQLLAPPAAVAPNPAAVAASRADDATRHLAPPDRRHGPGRRWSGWLPLAVGILALAVAIATFAVLQSLTGLPGAAPGRSPVRGAALPGATPRPTSRFGPAASPGPTARGAGSPVPSAVPRSPAATPAPAMPPTPVPTPAATTPPATLPPMALRILVPSTGTVVAARAIVVVGVAPPRAWVTRDIPMWPDDHTQADAAGRWAMTVQLRSGVNVLAFRLGDDRSTEIDLTVISAT